MALTDFSIEGMTAIVTGASRGIGKGIALLLAEAGVDLCIAARSEAPLEETASEIRALGRRCTAVVTDITNEQAVARMAQRALAELGMVDLLVNNAGLAVVKPLVPLPGFNPPTADSFPGFFEPYSLAEWSQVMDTNLTGAFLCMRALGPHMIERRTGRVVNISSVNAIRAGRYRFTYDVSKSGLCQLSRSIAVEWARFGVNVNAIAAGFVDTELTRVSMEDERLRARLMANIPLRRLASERDVALTVAYLASPAAAYMTGQTIFLDGGLSISAV